MGLALAAAGTIAPSVSASVVACLMPWVRSMVCCLLVLAGHRV
jgi:hypothetical protein